jgi:hypothetical protein
VLPWEPRVPSDGGDPTALKVLLSRSTQHELLRAASAVVKHGIGCLFRAHNARREEHIETAGCSGRDAASAGWVPRISEKVTAIGAGHAGIGEGHGRAANPLSLMVMVTTRVPDASTVEPFANDVRTHW